MLDEVVDESTVFETCPQIGCPPQKSPCENQFAPPGCIGVATRRVYPRPRSLSPPSVPTARLRFDTNSAIHGLPSACPRAFSKLVFRWLPIWILELPHRDYWLSGERRAASLNSRSDHVVFGCHHDLLHGQQSLDHFRKPRPKTVAGKWGPRACLVRFWWQRLSLLRSCWAILTPQGRPRVNSRVQRHQTTEIDKFRLL